MKLSEIGHTPIPGSDPIGQDARYEPSYEQLQAEIDKLASVTRTVEVDWQRVVDLAADILENRSKDLLAAAYMSVGLMQVQGLEGLAAGSQVLGDMAATFWDDCFPVKKRTRGRANAFSWWHEKTVAWLKGRPDGESVPADVSSTVIENVKKLDQILGERLPDFPPMRELIGLLERLPGRQVQQAPSASDQPGSGGSQSPGSSSDSTEEPPSVIPPPPPEDAGAARKAFAGSALTFAGMGRAQNPADPWAWKASRVAAWINIKGPPPSRGGQTMIPPPDTSIKAALLTRLSDGKLLDAAIGAEEHFTGAIFWLDLQRIIATALEGLGDDFAAALDVVRVELTALLNRLKGLDQLSFSDSTPFADPETRAWIASLALKPGSLDSAGTGDDPVKKVLDRANSRFVNKDEAGALDILTEAAGGVRDGYSRLLLRLGQMDLLCRAGRFAMASALADEMLMEIDNRALETWDPAMAVKALSACREAFIGLAGEEHLTKARKLAARISLIRPSAALNLAV